MYVTRAPSCLLARSKMVAAQELDVLEVALTHFAAGGVDATSLEAVAADAGLGLAELLARFQGTDGLFAAAMLAGTRELFADLELIAERDEPPVDVLAELARRLANPSPRERRALFALLREVLDGSDRLRVLYPQLLQPPVTTLIDVIGRAQFRGQVVPLPPRFVLVLLLCGVVVPQVASLGAVEGMLQGVHAPLPADPTEQSRSALGAACTQGVFQGLMVRDPPGAGGQGP
jgi:AcrR family transcriptional regulator